MNAYIKKVVLFSKDGDMREVPLDSGLNIITGDSKTGKSAIIEIIDYCLFASRSTIPVGKITEFTELFCIIIKVSTKYLIIARPHWKSKEHLKAYFSCELNEDFLGSFSFEYFSNKSILKYKDVQQDVEKHLGLAVSDTRENNYGIARKVSMRNFVSLLFQHQNLIANKHSLFYRFDDYKKREDTINQMPILLGWVNSEYCDLKRQLEAKEQELKKEQRFQDSMKLKQTELVERLLTPINEYYSAIGYILSDNLSLSELKKIAKNLPEVPKTSEEDSDIKNQISILKRERAEHYSKLSEINVLLEQINRNNSEAYSYSNMLAKIVLVNNFEENEHDIKCPVCNNKVSKINDAVKTVKKSREKLISELKNIGRYEYDNSEHINQLIEERDLCKKHIKIISTQILNLEKITQSVIKDQSLRETLLRLRERVQVTLEFILDTPKFNQNSSDIDELKNEIEQLKDRLMGYDVKAKIESANTFINKRMTEISAKLDFEKELQPGEMRFDLRNFDFHYLYNNQPIRLSEMGSGANWLACHLSLFLSLLHFNCKELKSCIPSFLFIDQPSQVYFPKATKVISEQEESDYDENIKQVKNIFKVILEELSNIEKDCGFLPQIVVMEHADEEEFNQYVKKRWANNDDDKLI